jgi:hypothetical protein
MKPKTYGFDLTIISIVLRKNQIRPDKLNGNSNFNFCHGFTNSNEIVVNQHCMLFQNNRITIECPLNDY